MYGLLFWGEVSHSLAYQSQRPVADLCLFIRRHIGSGLKSVKMSLSAKHSDKL